MTNLNEKLVSWLFETKAIRVCPEDKPFWYTSGTIGPYYINTHFLYGSEQKANELLKLIDTAKHNKLDCPAKILDETKRNYDIDPIYKGLIDEMCSLIAKNINTDSIDYISGGERRDWFFSLLIADRLNKPHITIYKDLSAVISENGITNELADLAGKSVLHIADLITEASSYERAWIPAISDRKGHIKWSVVVVDRKQGGEQLLNKNGINSLSMIAIDIDLFKTALSMGLIDEKQFTMIEEYIINPKEAMRNFLKKNKEFLEQSLRADERTAERAKICIEKNIYNL